MPYKNPEDQRKCSQRHYAKNKERIKQQKQAKRVKVRQRTQELMTPCVDCGAFDLRFMDWHHLDSSVKTKEVSWMIRDFAPWEAIKAEIEKCICLCANCHRIRHAGH